MDDLLRQLKNCSRFLELEDSIPDWESRIPELEERISEMKWNLQQKELEFLQWKEPNLFQRVFGRAEKRQKQLSRQICEIQAAQRAAQWEQEGLEKKIAEGKQELETLAGSWKAYEEAKKTAVLSASQESCLMMESISAFAPPALETARRAMMTLEEVRLWIRNKKLQEGSRKMELLDRAQDHTRRLLKILEALPEGAASPGSSFENLCGYICGGIPEYQQTDRLEKVQEQLRTVCNQLRLLLGE